MYDAMHLSLLLSALLLQISCSITKYLFKITCFASPVKKAKATGW